ncbi:hypothetical protein ABAZ39_30480 (plasmid) [Azospirillum argentinense]|uniref:Lipoprotein n=2 Tax=Azospirillum argentinense TaxID=2970906 RepID=A0A5B0L0P4_9PROT|nr:hypothetical protein [Azospirillum argentinense]AIB16185.1 hypothetical protein ABAZ39_30480 [Azospirillum argentinense]EZQ02663.1 hypothetical protein ABAZ39_31000 [Azospirillum argentinense]KAA1056814.1 hypothetical protein FH063_003687 [Azospirillum argentinense]MBK3802294.1 hypothetical protein [Azospirillum argentinense]PNQ95901.1 hypothetical protein C1S70_26340 [Azospirillum argentinense]
MTASPLHRAALATAALLALSGCAGFGSAVTGVTSAGVAATVGSATGNPVLGVIAGAGVSYGIDQGVKYAERRITDNVHNAVARAAGPLAVGQSATWTVEEKLPLSGKTGTVQVARGFGEAIPCKDVVFTLDDAPDFNVTTVCRAKDGQWRWALAEPSTRRWGSLQ